MEFIKKSSWTGEDWYESEDERYKIYKEDEKFICKILGATFSTQFTFVNARNFIELVHEAGYYNHIQPISSKESRELFYDRSQVKEFKRGEDWGGYACIGGHHEPYHDITIYKHIDTKEYRYFSYSIGD